MIFRKAVKSDVPKAFGIYEKILDEEEKGNVSIGWKRGVYPTEATASNAFDGDELYVLENDEKKVVASGIINNRQPDGYEKGSWKRGAKESEVLVLHTLTVDPSESGKGYGNSFVRFYEELAGGSGIIDLRLDTNAKNTRARKMYASLGYKEVGMVPVVFNGIDGVNLVLLEKELPQSV